MYSRLHSPPSDRSLLLLGPRGTGKTTWTKTVLPEAVRIDLLESRTYASLLADPQRLEAMIPLGKPWVVVDEIQRIPALLNEVHRLIEEKKIKFLLTGSSARKLRAGGVNLLAGRALTRAMHPLSAVELGADFDLSKALRVGLLPSAQTKDAEDYLATYVKTYLDEEVRQEGLTRNLMSFARFLEAASFSQACPLNTSAVARECSVDRKVVESYFVILDDLLIAERVPVFTKKAKRRLVSHSKFFFFDVGVFRTLRPSGPLDTPEEMEGPATETLLFQNIRAINDALGLGYRIYYWRTSDGTEVDFVLYGPRGLFGIEVKRGRRYDRKSLHGLSSFRTDYPNAKTFLVYGGDRRFQEGAHQVWPLKDFLMGLPDILNA
ncbi:MAG: ATP-binding protein [Elusimicrobia bacterium]|nr:ATP-binding protein [Elusimicrobiota bacterium]